MDISHIKQLLDAKCEEYEQPEFIASDPICVPHRFDKAQDIEIAGFFASILAWGNRRSIINSCNRLMELMDEAPYDFVRNHQERDRIRFLHFVHRTFNATDLLFFLHRLQLHYQSHESLVSTFFPKGNEDAYLALSYFHQYFFSLEEAPERSRKHIGNPLRGSACKRLNMYLRWMVRRNSPVDFGLWNSISPAKLVIPLDTHSGQVSRRLGLLTRKQNDWKSVTLLTDTLRSFDAQDPVKYDYALFALGAEERLNFRR